MSTARHAPSAPTVPAPLSFGAGDLGFDVFETDAANSSELTAELAAAWACAPDRWGHLVEHVRDDRWYLPLFSHPQASGWLITWGPGTGLDLHDHGEAAGTIAVVAGRLTERYTVRSQMSEGSAALRRRDLTPGSITTFAPDHVHEVRNESAEPAVTIHVYAPRLEGMAFYSPGALAAARELQARESGAAA